VIARIAAIVRVDVLIRFRRLSTLVVFLLLSAFAYVWMPDPSTGRALMRVGGARAVYNSAAVGIASAMLASLFIGLVGFYVVSNAIARDLVTRCGSVIASTEISSGEYLAGKFAGNAIFLAVFTGGFMLVSMAMVVVRGEAPLEPWTIMAEYTLLVPSAIVLVSALAILFESVPFLSGRAGEVLYFLLWAGLIAASTALVINHVPWAVYFDPTGLAFLMRQIEATHGPTRIAIGAGPFDPARPLVVVEGLRANAAMLAPRFVATLVALALLLVARAAFHRFDPARVRGGERHAKRGWGARLAALAKPAARLVWRIPARGAVAADALMTFAAHPIAVVALFAIAIATAASSGASAVAFAAAAIFVSDVATRDRTAGAAAMIYAAPSLRERFVLWKFASSLAVVSVLLVIPAIRVAISRPAALPAFAAGLAFIAGAAAGLGVISANPKTFVVLFLSFWYLVVSDHGATPALDFAGFYGVPRAAVSATYLAIAIVLLVAAEGVHRARLRA
jgi:hypothetical protein